MSCILHNGRKNDKAWFNVFEKKDFSLYVHRIFISSMLFNMHISLLFSALSIAGPLVAAANNGQTSLTLLFQNNLNYTDDKNHVGFILLDPFTSSEAAGQCAGFGESLVTSSEINANLADFNASFSYLVFATYTHRDQQYIISDGIVTYDEASAAITFSPYPAGNPALPVLCTQSSNQDQPTNSYPTPSNQVSIASTGNTYVGYRNQKSFRFLGIPYANPPQRWEHSTLYSPTGGTLNATAYGPECPQYGSGAEFCLYLNIQTPYIPKAGSTANLRPVFFWIHGGGFTSGSAADPGTDGGNLASREDIVVVQIQYRLSTLGFLAIPGTDITGNYGIADQINALEVRKKNRKSNLCRANYIIVDYQERCKLWWRSNPDYYWWRLGWSWFCPNSPWFSARERKIPGRDRSVQLGWRC